MFARSVRSLDSAEAQAYLARRIGEGKSRAEALRALKRYVARRIFHRWQRCLDLLAPIDQEVQMT